MLEIDFTVGLANPKTITIQPGGKDQTVLLATTKTKKQNKPARLFHRTVMKKDFRRMAKAVKNQVSICFHDLVAISGLSILLLAFLRYGRFLGAKVEFLRLLLIMPY